jgi:hypothetical protein
VNNSEEVEIENEETEGYYNSEGEVENHDLIVLETIFVLFFEVNG